MQGIQGSKRCAGNSSSSMWGVGRDERGIGSGKKRGRQ